MLQKQPPKVFCKKGVLKNFAILTGKHLYWSLFAGLQVCFSFFYLLFLFCFQYKHTISTKTLVHKINFKIKLQFVFTKILGVWGLKEKTKTTNKQTNERNKQHKNRGKEIPSQPNPFFRKIFHVQCTCFYLKILLSNKHKPFMSWNNVIYLCHFLVNKRHQHFCFPTNIAKL